MELVPINVPTACQANVINTILDIVDELIYG